MHGTMNIAEVFPCFFLSCKANAGVKLAKMGHGPHSSKLVFISVFLLLFVSLYVLFVFVLFYVLFVCTVLLPPGVNTFAVDKYVIYITKNDQDAFEHYIGTFCFTFWNVTGLLV